jgi:hypothetical protein
MAEASEWNNVKQWPKDTTVWVGVKSNLQLPTVTLLVLWESVQSQSKSIITITIIRKILVKSKLY